MSTFNLAVQLVDIYQRTIYPAKISVQNNRIVAIEKIDESALKTTGYLMPGFIDSHVHIESSMLIPSEFARIAVMHGTVGTVSDPHEIANVCGLEGIQFMINNGKQVPFKFNFGAPSCVPATVFETAGAALDSQDVEALLASDDIKYLSEMMNFPGVLHSDLEVMKKIAAAHRAGKPVDGHAPGLTGASAKQYIEAGISTDHECFTLEEAVDKLSYGMKIIIREGSAAKNFEALAELIDDHPNMIMLCSDDKHPDSLVEGHINQLCARAVAKGLDVFNVLKAACINPVKHYNLNIGTLRVGDPADFIIVEDLTHFKVLQTYIDGQALLSTDLDSDSALSTPSAPSALNATTSRKKSLIKSVPATPINHFTCAPVNEVDLSVPVASYPNQDGLIPVIEALDGQLITNKLYLPATIVDDCYVSNTADDILKMVVVNRYHMAPVAKSFIKNFGFHTGAIASTVAHDSHNIVAVGATDEAIAAAINAVIAAEGGISCVDSNNQTLVLPLPVAGLMSTEDGFVVAQKYTAIDAMAKSLGSSLSAPFMTLSFMALLVIPHLKLSDKGIFDGDRFAFL
ncbi:MAG TPA: adenine deaminase [Sediminibacterium sp.]|uniref:adenine deaminase n=1 Tax=Sediminibacterium sp. TaxID=1917865 RepID=UPI0008B36183|nr:adenine deaminase [Sediminibacterium sp.]OHC84785.1 MAG: adenine deaminase [Sphingobacteriia bacterium RIFOXYC2_FULL_35_18]OHC88157.1 MAG: adenine deaminase [Sphingobacteriia bacterium RIFOXYD2_FULL_35_12]HLD53302.1 adenine deaminase [Sediminibacterium sp.]